MRRPYCNRIVPDIRRCADRTSARRMTGGPRPPEQPLVGRNGDQRFAGRLQLGASVPSIASTTPIQHTGDLPMNTTITPHFTVPTDAPVARGRSPLRRFFGVVWQAQSYRNIGYLLLGLVLATAWFTLLVTALSVSLSLVVVALLGIPLLLATWYAVRAFANVERGLANVLLGHEPPGGTDGIEAPRQPVGATRRHEPGTQPLARARLPPRADPCRHRHVRDHRRRPRRAPRPHLGPDPRSPGR